MPIVNKPDMSYGVWASGGNIEIPSSEKVEEGWVIEKPLNEWMNWLQNRQDKMLAYLNQRGIGEWDIRTDYPLNALVSRSGVIYQALSQNTDKDPTLNLDIWKIAFVSYSDFADYAEKIDSIENDEGYLGLYVSKANPVMTGIAKGVSYNDSTGVSGLGFSELSPKISNKGITVAEFSGGTNPKDVVTHEQLALAIQNYKVGDIYITTADGNPITRLGYGSWERFGKGKTLVGFSDEVSNTIPEWVKTSGTVFGSYSHTLTVDELASHTHRVSDTAGTQGQGESFDLNGTSGNLINTKGIENTGGNQPHNNVQPSVVVYFWKRIS